MWHGCSRRPDRSDATPRAASAAPVPAPSHLHPRAPAHPCPTSQGDLLAVDLLHSPSIAQGKGKATGFRSWLAHPAGRDVVHMVWGIDTPRRIRCPGTVGWRNGLTRAPKVRQEPQRFNKSKYKDMYLGMKNSMTQEMLGSNCLESSFAEQEVRVLVDTKLNGRRQCARANKLLKGK